MLRHFSRACMEEARRSLVGRQVYLTGPMSGLPLHNFPAFEEARETLRGWGVNVDCPAEVAPEFGFAPEVHDTEPVENYPWNRWAAERLVDADAVVLLAGAENSSVVRAEWEVIQVLGTPTYLYVPAEANLAGAEVIRIPHDFIREWLDLVDSGRRHAAHFPSFLREAALRGVLKGSAA